METLGSRLFQTRMPEDVLACWIPPLLDPSVILHNPGLIAFNPRFYFADFGGTASAAVSNTYRGKDPRPLPLAITNTFCILWRV